MKKLFLSVTLLMCTHQIFAQKFFGNVAQDITAELKSNFPLIVVLIFLVGGLCELGGAFGDKGDWKKSLGRVLIFTAAVSMIVSLVAYFSTITL